MNADRRLTRSESELLYDWRFTANQFVLAPSPLRLTAWIFSQLHTCGHSPYITSSLTRGWVCHLQLLLALASAFILGSESRGTHDHILLSQIRNFPFVASYDSQGYGGGIRSRLHTGTSLSQSHFTTGGLPPISSSAHSQMNWINSLITSRRTEYKSPCHTVILLLFCLFVATETCLQNRCPAMDYSASIHCRGNVLTEPLPSNGNIRHSMLKRVVHIVTSGLNKVKV
jgi:hypothetical protein